MDHKQTNEELALLVQSGNITALEALWYQVKALAGVIARRLISGHRERLEKVASYEDLEQELFLAVWEAAKDYDTGKGYAFNSYLNNHILHHIMALLGYRTSRRDAWGYSTSIDQEIPGADDLTIGDAISDPSAERDLEYAEDRIWGEQLRSDLDAAFSSLNPRWVELLQLRYYRDQTLSAAGENLNVSAQTASEWERKAFRKLRKMRRLIRHREEIMSTHGYRSGLQSFQNTKASSVELTVEKLEKLEEFMDMSLDEIWEGSTHENQDYIFAGGEGKHARSVNCCFPSISGSQNKRK